ncbi:MAG: hypothetical protein QW404_00870 [Candidatus Nanoarchaeia archaeon]
MADDLEDEEMQLHAFHITDMLVKTPGVPSRWEVSPQNVTVLGLASDDRVLSAEKIDAMANLSYETTKDLFDIHPYDYSLKVKTFGGVTLKELGLNYTSQDTKRVNLYRYVIFNGQRALFEFTVWK